MRLTKSTQTGQGHQPGIGRQSDKGCVDTNGLVRAFTTIDTQPADELWQTNSSALIRLLFAPFNHCHSCVLITSCSDRYCYALRLKLRNHCRQPRFLSISSSTAPRMTAPSTIF